MPSTCARSGRPIDGVGPDRSVSLPRVAGSLPGPVARDQTVQVVDRLLQDLARFDGFPRVKVETPQIKVRICEIVTDAGRVESEGREWEASLGPGGIRGFASQSILDRQRRVDRPPRPAHRDHRLRGTNCRDSEGFGPGPGARGSLRASRAQAVPAGPKSDSSPRLRVPLDCSNGA